MLMEKLMGEMLKSYCDCCIKKNYAKKNYIAIYYIS